MLHHISEILIGARQLLQVLCVLLREEVSEFLGTFKSAIQVLNEWFLARLQALVLTDFLKENLLN